jgi:putative phosphonate metabolism protein
LLASGEDEPPMRYAIYYTPPEDDPLTRLAQTWLGRNAFTGEIFPPRPVGSLPAAEIAYQTAAARRYGFHATLKAPFQLAEDEDEQELTAALSAFCGQMAPFTGPRLALRRLDGFLALVPEQPSLRLDEFARDVVVAFERFRAPLTEAELARRNPDALSPRQLKNLHQWGYPYVFEEFRFHMTLTGRVADADAPRVMRAIEEHFGPVLEEPPEIGSLALFVEPEPGAPFTVHSFHEFGRLPERKSA